jgi:hypothetical protein
VGLAARHALDFDSVGRLKVVSDRRTIPPKEVKGDVIPAPGSLAVDYPIDIVDHTALTDSDGETSQYVALINEEMAKRYWPNEDAIGRHYHAITTLTGAMIGDCATVLGKLVHASSAAKRRPAVTTGTRKEKAWAFMFWASGRTRIVRPFKCWLGLLSRSAEFATIVTPTVDACDTHHQLVASGLE